MSVPNRSSAAFFEAKYRSAAGADPWNFAGNTYELQRYDAILQALRGRRYHRAFEPGCSIGVLTEQLASLCDRVEACDFAATAVAAATARCAAIPNVNVCCRALHKDEPWERFDLIVLCEIGYYFTAVEWKELVEAMVQGMRPGAVVLASHWLGSSVDHVQTGDEVHAQLQHPGLQSTLTQRYEGFRLDRWIRMKAQG